MSYGWISTDANGNTVRHEFETEEEYKVARRKYPLITDDNELVEKAREWSGNWYDAGHKGTFEGYYLSPNGDYWNRLCQTLTKSEWNRLIELQKETRQFTKECEQRMFKAFEEKRPLTYDECKAFLMKRVCENTRHWGTNDYYTDCSKRYMENCLTNKFPNGIPFEVYRGYTHEGYGFWGADIDHVFMSDGTVHNEWYPTD